MKAKERHRQREKKVNEGKVRMKKRRRGDKEEREIKPVNMKKLKGWQQ